jgi:hypothetical protein
LLFQWLNMPALALSTPPTLTFAAFQSATALGSLSLLHDVESNRLELAELLMRSYESEGEDVVPGWILQGMWMPVAAGGRRSLPVGWIDSQWGRQFVMWLNQDVDDPDSDRYPLTWFDVAMHSTNTTLRRRYPDPICADHASFCRWLAAEGGHSLGTPEPLIEALAREVRRAEVRSGRRPSGERRFRLRRPRDPEPLDLSRFVRNPPDWDRPAEFVAPADMAAYDRAGGEHRRSRRRQQLDCRGDARDAALHRERRLRDQRPRSRAGIVGPSIRPAARARFVVPICGERLAWQRSLCPQHIGRAGTTVPV